jgi:hypothetical protein
LLSKVICQSCKSAILISKQSAVAGTHLINIRQQVLQRLRQITEATLQGGSQALHASVKFPHRLRNRLINGNIRRSCCGEPLLKFRIGRGGLLLILCLQPLPISLQFRLTL